MVPAVVTVVSSAGVLSLMYDAAAVLLINTLDGSDEYWCVVVNKDEV